MKVREAQVLGIVALISVVIFLLLIYGGEGEPEGASATGGQTEFMEEAGWDPSLTELVERLTQDEFIVEEEQEQLPIEEATMEIGGEEVFSGLGPTEDARIR
ncbi:MAG: hypothetical protein ACYS1C_04925, partial [Planctomycetota bacterium]